MTSLITASARNALIAGLLVCGAVLALWMSRSPIDPLGLLSFVVRWLHVLAGVIWVGMIWFVNFIQLAALEEADEGGRSAIMRHVAPRVAQAFRGASHLTLVSGFVLLATTGYIFDRWVFATAVYVPPMKAALLWFGTAAAITMWVFVHMIIWPAMRTLTSDSGADADAKAAARFKIRKYARLNLVLAIPVTFVMIAAAHLY